MACNKMPIMATNGYGTNIPCPQMACTKMVRGQKQVAHYAILCMVVMSHETRQYTTHDPPSSETLSLLSNNVCLTAI